MLNLLNSLPLNGYKTYIAIGIAVVVTGLQQLGYLDPGVAMAILKWDAMLFGVGLAHKVDKTTAAVAALPSAQTVTGGDGGSGI